MNTSQGPVGENGAGGGVSSIIGTVVGVEVMVGGGVAGVGRSVPAGSVVIGFSVFGMVACWVSVGSGVGEDAPNDVHALVVKKMSRSRVTKFFFCIV
jgi:hypothetical protein